MSATSVYVVAVQWLASTINPPLVDAALSEQGDWLRFNAETWLLYTGATPTDVRNLILKHLSPQDHVLVLPLSLTDPADGWAPPWVWDWLKGRAQAAAIARFATYVPPPPPLPKPD